MNKPNLHYHLNIITTWMVLYIHYATSHIWTEYMNDHADAYMPEDFETQMERDQDWWIHYGMQVDSLMASLQSEPNTLGFPIDHPIVDEWHSSYLACKQVSSSHLRSYRNAHMEKARILHEYFYHQIFGRTGLLGVTLKR